MKEPCVWNVDVSNLNLLKYFIMFGLDAWKQDHLFSFQGKNQTEERQGLLTNCRQTLYHSVNEWSAADLLSHTCNMMIYIDLFYVLEYVVCSFVLFIAAVIIIIG